MSKGHRGQDGLQSSVGLGSRDTALPKWPGIRIRTDLVLAAQPDGEGRLPGEAWQKLKGHAPHSCSQLLSTTPGVPGSSGEVTFSLPFFLTLVHLLIERCPLILLGQSGMPKLAERKRFVTFSVEALALWGRGIQR